jgi:hypothetical protein
MDNYRRRPPMEGFSLPGQLGGEAFDDDEVEGHTMTISRKFDDDDTEGHGGTPPARRIDDDDTEGHGGGKKATDDDDDTEGHTSLRNLR